MRWLTAHFSTIPQQQTSCKRSTWCFFFSAEDISAYDVWQIHAAGGFTALRAHARNSLTTLIDRTYCAHFKSRRSVWWEESGRGGAETLRNGSETYEFTCIYTNRPMTHDASLDKHLWGTTVSNSISTQTWKIIITQSTSRIRCVTHRNTREAGDIPIMEGCSLILQVAGWSGVVGKPWNDSQKYITVDNLVAAQACRRVTGENHFLKHRVEACSVQNNRLAALLFISSSITGLICRDEKCQGNGKRCFVWLVIHLTFYLFGQHTGLSDNLLALFLRKADTSYFLLRAVSVSQEVLHFIFSGLKKSSHPSFCSIDFIQWSYLFVGFGGDATEGAVYIYKTHKSTIKCRGVKSPDGFSHFSVFLNACVIQKQVTVHTCLLKSSKIQ